MSSQRQLYKIAEELNDVVQPALYFMSAMERRLYMDKLDEKLRITETLQEVVKCIYSIRKATPMSEYAKVAVDKAYEAANKVKPIFEELGSYEKWKDKFWSSDIEFFGDYVKKLLEETKEPLEIAIKDIGEEREDMDKHYRAGELSKEPPRKRRRAPWEKEDAEDENATAAGKALAMVTFLALGFVMLNGLNNLGAIPPGGELPSISTGFFLLPGGPFVSSMQMVLFLLTSAVVIVYLFGKSAGEW